MVGGTTQGRGGKKRCGGLALCVYVIGREGGKAEGRGERGVGGRDVTFFCVCEDEERSIKNGNDNTTTNATTPTLFAFPTFLCLDS